MTLTAINGSAKGEQSNSREIISILQGMLNADATVTVVSQMGQFRRPDDGIFPAMAASDVLFVASSLYVDALPASLMRLLERYEEFLGSPAGKSSTAGRAKPQRVFAAVNCGFYEGEQNEFALRIIAHWCEAAGLEWRGGIGLGTGEMIAGLKNVPPQAGIRKPVIGAIRKVADAIAAGDGGRLSEPVYAHHAFPWILYKLAGEAGWRAQAKSNGLKPRALYARPLER